MAKQPIVDTFARDTHVVAGNTPPPMDSLSALGSHAVLAANPAVSGTQARGWPLERGAY